jgi:hypothetical protein
VPALSSSLISAALEQIADLPAGDRELLAAGRLSFSADGQAVHLLAVLDHQTCAVLGQADVDGKTNEVTQFAPLLEPPDLTGHVVTADALHTQRGHAELLATGKNAHYSSS